MRGLKNGAPYRIVCGIHGGPMGIVQCLCSYTWLMNRHGPKLGVLSGPYSDNHPSEPKWAIHVGPIWNQTIPFFSPVISQTGPTYKRYLGLIKLWFCYYTSISKGIPSIRNKYTELLLCPFCTTQETCLSLFKKVTQHLLWIHFKCFLLLLE